MNVPQIACIVCLFALAASVGLAPPQGIAHLTIARDGQTDYVIFVDPDATEAEHHAAGELVLFLQEVTGAEFRMVPAVTEGMRAIYVGPQAAALRIPGFSTEGLGSDGIVMRTVGADLVLACGRPRGTLYAVYTFLEDVVGCRWWAPGESTIPHKPTLMVAELDVRYVPRIEYRETYWMDKLVDGE